MTYAESDLLPLSALQQHWDQYQTRHPGSTLNRRCVPQHVLSLVLVVLVSACTSFAAEPTQRDDSGKQGDYDQWKLAKSGSPVTGAAEISLLKGFRIELLRVAGKDEGSWISLEFDPRGRLIVAREDQGLLRMTLPRKKDEAIRIESINDTLLECRGLLYAYDSLYTNANNSKGLYRLRDTNGDDRFDEVKLLRATAGGVGHGRNDLALGPDGRIYLIHGNNVQLPQDFDPAGSPVAYYDVDRLLTCRQDSSLFDASVLPPAGHVIRTDRDGRAWELVASGFRNPFGIDFGPDGEMFTFDADMEWDAGAPWYRPCRVNHITSGGDYGWRQGTGKWRAWYPDSLPSNLDVGLASPTAVKFGTQSHFPPRYRRALFILDWAYGRILAVHMQPNGASYSCQSETFVRGRPLNVTDLAFGPKGAMYFVIGGRRTQSALYRVSYVGPRLEEPPPSNVDPQRKRLAATARAIRRRLEAFHGRQDPSAIDVAWPHLANCDPWIRHAARVAVEHQPLHTWRERALSEENPTTTVTALLAMTRVAKPALAPRILAKLAMLELGKLDEVDQRFALRTYALAFIRLGRPDDATAVRVAKHLRILYPAKFPTVNEQLAELFVYLETPDAATNVLALLSNAQTQEEKLHYLFVLRQLHLGWTAAQRKTYFRWIGDARQFQGARYMPQFVDIVKTDALAAVPAAERPALAAILKSNVPPASAPDPNVKRPFVRRWQLDDLAGSLDAASHGRNYERGKALFTAASCVRCHQLAGQGQLVGPDLTKVAARFGRRDILEAILLPSKVVGEKYRNVMIATDDGRMFVGGIVGSDEQTLFLRPDPMLPEHVVRIEKASIEEQHFSLTSPMPAGALDTMTKEEILDLLAYIEEAGDASRANFKKTP